MIKGACSCGGVEYGVEVELLMMYLCHCSECRKMSGSSYSTKGAVLDAQFNLLKGESNIKSFKKNETTTKFFCFNCGSPIYSQTKNVEGLTFIDCGLLDDDPGKSVDTQCFYGSRAPWLDKSSCAQVYEEAIN